MSWFVRREGVMSPKKIQELARFKWDYIVSQDGKKSAEEKLAKEYPEYGELENNCSFCHIVSVSCDICPLVKYGNECGMGDYGDWSRSTCTAEERLKKAIRVRDNVYRVTIKDIEKALDAYEKAEKCEECKTIITNCVCD